VGSGNAGGESEAIIGRWLARRGRRDDVVIATTVGMAGGPTQPKGLTRDKIRQGVEASLARLQTDHIDLYYAHEGDAETPLTETMAAFDELVREGKVRAIAASNYSAERLREALDVSAKHGFARCEALQPNDNLMERDEYEGDVADLCVEEGLGVAPPFALARGFLTGKYRPDTPRHAVRRRDFGELPQRPRLGGSGRSG
jgi:aryl-alcohol dehydrogenase (NADP+)